MAKKKLFGILDRRPLIWVHYIVLSLIVVMAMYLKVAGFSFSGSTVNLIEMGKDFVYYFLVISLSDQLIHSKYILNTD